MDENGLKAAALTRIRRDAKGRALPIVTSEFSLTGTGIRADLAVLDRNKFLGVEIKSASDTLKRLPSQMEGYARYFDQIELIVAPKHLRGLRNIDVHGAKIWRAEVLGDWQIHATGVSRVVSGQWLLHLLTAEDERRAIRAVERQAADFSPPDIDKVRREEFVRAFKRRYAETSNRFWEAVRGRPIAVEDLKLLSRYRAGREQQREIDRERAERLAAWVATMQAPLHVL